MKLSSSFLALALTLASASAFAAPLPNYRCVSKATKFSYLVLPKFGEIHEFDEKGVNFGHQDSLSPRVRVRNGQTVVSFVHEEGNVIFTIYERGKKITASYDDDDTLVCTKGAKSPF